MQTSAETHPFLPCTWNPRRHDQVPHLFVQTTHPSMATMIRRRRIAPQRRTVHLFIVDPDRESLALIYGGYPNARSHSSGSNAHSRASQNRWLPRKSSISVCHFPTAMSVPILSAAPERKSEGVTPMSMCRTNVTRNRRVLKSISSSACHSDFQSNLLYLLGTKVPAFSRRLIFSYVYKCLSLRLDAFV
jgi:hypothetical protein